MSDNDPRWGLVQRYVQGDAGPDVIAELTARLREDAEFRTVFLEYLNVDLALSQETDPNRKAEAPVVGPSRRRIFTRTGSLILAASVFLAVLALVSWQYRGRSGTPVATVVASFHGQWCSGGEVVEGENLITGVQEFQSGLIELRTSSGATLMVQAPASLELTGPLSARLLSGSVVVRMPRGQSGFVVETPQVVVTDLGTEFGISVASDAGSRVQVFDGSVRAESGGHEARQLVAGESLDAASDGTFRPGPFDEERFVRRFPPAPPRTVPGGVLYSKSQVHEVSIVCRERPKLDGDLADWDHAHAFRSACLPPYNETYRLEGMMGCDAENLYIAAHVRDPEPMRNRSRGPLLFAGGSVIVRLAADRGLRWPLQGYSRFFRGRKKLPPQDADNPSVVSMILTYDSAAEKPGLELHYGLDFKRPASPPEGWSGTFRRDADGQGYTLEYSVPWRLLNCESNPPRAGDTLASLWTVHWSDADGRICRGQLIDVTSDDPAAAQETSPANYFQFGPTWGRARVIDPSR